MTNAGQIEGDNAALCDVLTPAPSAVPIPKLRNLTPLVPNTASHTAAFTCQLYCS